MAFPEQYHTLQEYLTQGINPFIKHAKAYLEGGRTVPVSRSNVPHHATKLDFTFSTELLERFVAKAALEKPYEVALKYGFRGHSAGGRNDDSSLLLPTERLIQQFLPEISADLQVEGLDALRKIKIVWHNIRGRRVVGVYNPELNRAIFLGIAQY